MSQFTGLQAESFRKPEPAKGAPLWELAEAHTTLAEMLRAQGYRTAAFVDNHNIGPHFGFAQGFELYDDSAAHVSIEEPSGGIDHVVPRALAWLDGLSAGEPVFLFLQVLDAHGPYLAGGSFDGAFDHEPSRAQGRHAPISLEEGSIFAAIPRYVAAPHVSKGHQPTVEELADDYDEGVLKLDGAIRRLVAALQERKILERAFLVVSADHGESLVEHDSYFNHQLLYSQDLHVPLLVRPPGGSAPRRVAADVQLVDLLPTFAEWSGAKLPRPVDGRSLARAVAGDELAPCASLATCAFQEGSTWMADGWRLVRTAPSPSTSGLVGFLTAPRVRAWLARRFPEHADKVIGTSELPLSVLDGSELDALWEEARRELQGPFFELYDLRNDPNELHDIAALNPERVAALRESLERELAKARSAFLPAETSARTSETLQAELEKLGY